MTSPALEQVVAQAERLPFVVLVSWLERLLGGSAEVGGPGPFQDEPVRFRHEPSLAFHSADVAGARLRRGGASRVHVELTTTFAGLTGAASPLPPLLLEGLARADDDDALERDFLDLFHHRFLGLLYRGLLKFDLPRGFARQGPRRALDWLLLLGGLAPANAERVSGLPRGQLFRLAPLLVSYPANAERLAVALRVVLEDVLGEAEVQVAEMRGGYVDIDPSARARLGVDLRLGLSSALGGRAPAPASEIGVLISPLTPEACASLSPGGERFPVLNAVVLLFTPESVRVVIELTPVGTLGARLGRENARLGRHAWLGGGRAVPVRFLADPAQIGASAGAADEPLFDARTAARNRNPYAREAAYEPTFDAHAAARTPEKDDHAS